MRIGRLWPIVEQMRGLIAARFSVGFAMSARYLVDAAEAPELGGAYVLLVRLRASTSVSLAGRPVMVFPPGRFLYCGSAYGPGGLRARLRRHMRPDKRVHWHIDHLTTQGDVEGAWAYPGETECRLVDRLRGRGLAAPHAGFGASDCQAGCRSHLLAWPNGAAVEIP